MGRAMPSALELRPGNVIRHGGRACIVTSWDIVRNDRRQWVRMKVRDVETGNLSDIKESSETKFEVLDKDEKDLAYSYRDGPVEVFFTHDGEEVRCPVHAAEDALLWPADSYVGFYVDGKLVSISPPKMCVIEVAETTPPIKNAGTGQKEAVLANGVKIKVGQIIDVGDRVRVDTEAMEFRERVT
jgi:translation elongation factor P/translation initiation factor 5A